MERNTQQRTAIKTVFQEVDRPLSPKEVLERGGKHAPGLGIATVYRTIKSLVEDEWLKVVDVPGEPPRYERAGKPHHHHFHCRQCGRMYEVDGCLKNLPSLLPAGFSLDEHEIFLYGKCRECGAAAKK